ncbi:MAG TPA: hypothetical protein VFA43_26560, partial [Gemmatimonadaceae bacterium]|nr:hypothetical protein [Gemmatimonadaceae bacterium]
RFDDERLHQSLRRRLKWAQWASPPNEYRRPSLTDLAWGDQLAERVIHVVRGSVPRFTGTIDLMVIDDDGRATHNNVFATSMQNAGVRFSDNGTRIVALFGDVTANRGRVGYTPETLATVADAKPALVIQFGPPRWAAALTGAPNVISAWGGDRTMQNAAARWLKRAAM